MFNQFRRTAISKFAKFGPAVTKKQNLFFSSVSASAGIGPHRYSNAMQFIHWTMGGSLIACVGFVQAAQYTKGKEKGRMMFLHKSFGVLAAGMLLPRVALRLGSALPKHIPGPSWETMSANLMHWALYGFMIVMPASGVAMGYYGGKGLPFFFTTLPGAAKADGKTAKFAFTYHKLIGHYSQYLIPLHVGAVGYHLVIRGKNILPRILPFGKVGP
mmetsp:Transcript_2044/g.3593  ORF Transcript_2044/g.3593 Transcript_2044/m.3593 type:complete len:215 (-) Transcript_2044:328-972(-)